IICIDIGRNNAPSQQWFTGSNKVMAKLKEFGTVEQFVLARDRKSVLIRYESRDEAHDAKTYLHGKFLNLCRLQVDLVDDNFVSHFRMINRLFGMDECQREHNWLLHVRPLSLGQISPDPEVV